MPRKGENIRKRKDGRWEGRYKKEDVNTGNMHYVSVYGKTYRQVKEKLNFAKYETSAIKKQIPATKSFGEVLEMWEKAHAISLKKSSKQKYEYLINTHILPTLGTIKLSQITSSAINAFLLQKLNNGRIDGKGGLSPSYVNGMMIIIQSALDFAITQQLCAPLSTPLYKPKSIKSELEIISHQNQDKIERYAKDQLTPTTVGILISLYTGLRIGEICALSWDDVNLDEQIIYVRHTITRIGNQSSHPSTKTKLIIDRPKTLASNRIIPIPSVLFPILTAFKKMSPSNFVVSHKKEFISPRTYEYRFHRVLDACGVPSVNYHTLRHTFASRCVEAGVDVKTLSEILGHKNPTITLNTYVHSSFDQKQRQLEKLVSFLAG